MMPADAAAKRGDARALPEPPSLARLPDSEARATAAINNRPDHFLHVGLTGDTANVPVESVFGFYKPMGRTSTVSPDVVRGLSG